MKQRRQQQILDIINARRVGTQQELAKELLKRGLAATQSSVSRDIVEMGLAKVNGYYTAPQAAVSARGPVVEINTAGDNLIVVKTATGQASPAALAIDRARLTEVVGTVAGDDTILIAVKDLAAQRAAVKKIIKLFSAGAGRSGRGRKPDARAQARWF